MDILKQLFTEFEDYRNNHICVGKPDGLYDAMQYIMNLGGKRARPLLVLSACQSAGANPQVALPIALAIEQFHNFTLIHDDIMDQAELRRGKPTVHKKWSTATAILAGDNLLVSAYNLLFKCQLQKREEILDLFNTVAREVCEGQQMDMEFMAQDHVSESDYLNMIRLKTAVLLGCAASCGALAAGVSSNDAKDFYEYAINLGMAFQMKDDWLDAFGDPKKTGKVAGGDIIEGKKTWLYIAAENKGLGIKEIYSIADARTKVSKTLELFKKHELDKELKSLSDQFNEIAQEHLNKLKHKGYKTQALSALSKALADRKV